MPGSTPGLQVLALTWYHKRIHPPANLEHRRPFLSWESSHLEGQDIRDTVLGSYKLCAPWPRPLLGRQVLPKESQPHFLAAHLHPSQESLWKVSHIHSGREDYSYLQSFFYFWPHFQ